MESPEVPVALLVEKEISGQVLGKSVLRPFGLATDSRGAVYVCDAGNNRIVKFYLDLTPDVEIGGFGTSEGAFNRPTFIVIDNDLNLLVSDEGNRRICRYNSRLQFVEELGFYEDEDPLKFGYPSGVNLTDYGEVWVADRERNRIAVFNNVGTFDRFIGEFGYAGGQLRSPEKIVKNQRGGFIACDAGNSRLVAYDEYGNFLREISDDSLDYPISAASDNRRLWILDGAVGKIYMFDGWGRKVFQAGPTLAPDSRALKEPSDMVILPDGRLMISDSGNNRLLICRILFEER
jgi:sugar lactone lactonase YvrE